MIIFRKVDSKTSLTYQLSLLRVKYQYDATLGNEFIMQSKKNNLNPTLIVLSYVPIK